MLRVASIISWLLLPLLFCIYPQDSLAREQIRVVGSSTVFPFIAAAAEHFGKSDAFKTPIVEATGTGGGIKLFCAGVGDDYPDMANASRPIKSSEVESCRKNGVTEITELPIGYDGIVIAMSKEGEAFFLTRKQLFQALAHDIPKDGALVLNPYKRWRDIAPSLPDLPIIFYGPPPTSGTRDAFVELVMEKGCESFPEFKAKYADKDELKKACSAFRADGAYIESGENDNLIVQKLVGNKEALGIFGYSFMEENAAKIKACDVDGQSPTYESISDGSYSIARSLFVYVKNAHKDKVPGLAEFAQEFTSDAAVGEDGYLILKGLIPLPQEAHKDVKQIARELTPMQ